MSSDKKMNGRHKKSRYQVISFFQELMVFFVISFLYFPSRIKRIILFCVYSGDHKPSLIYPSLKEEILHSSFIIDVDPIPSSETHEKDDVHILIYPEPDNSFHSVDNSDDRLHSTISAENCNHHVEPYIQPTDVQSKTRREIFKPLRMPLILHDYPPNFIDYLPLFNGGHHVTIEKHLTSFEKFIDNFEIIHGDVVMRIFFKYFFRDVALWFRNMEACSICS